MVPGEAWEVVSESGDGRGSKEPEVIGSEVEEVKEERLEETAALGGSPLVRARVVLTNPEEAGGDVARSVGSVDEEAEMDGDGVETKEGIKSSELLLGEGGQLDFLKPVGSLTHKLL